MSKAKSRSLKYNGLELQNGNSKLGLDTIIFNMGTATDCPSKKLGLCKIDNCYALNPEAFRPPCKPYRERQAEYWLHTDADKIISDFDAILRNRRVRVNGKLTPIYKTIKYFRYNEAGDFYSQDCVSKLDKIALYLKETFGIKTYGYTARSDLDFKEVKHFAVKGSGYYRLGNSGMTIARSDATIADNMANTHEYRETILRHNLLFKVCPGNCRTCKLCKTGEFNVVFPIH